MPAADTTMLHATEAPPSPPASTRRWLWWPGGTLLGLVAAWAVPYCAHQVRLDWIALLGLLVATSAVLRSGTTLLDRLVFAATLLAGSLMIAAIGFTWWRWGLQPVAVAGSAGTVIVLTAASLRRAPQLPLRLRPAEIPVLLAGGIFALGMWWPFVGRGTAGELGIVMSGGDSARHFAMVDTIRQLGGYVFLNQDDARGSIQDVHLSYPQGWHMIVALVDNFVTSSTSASSTLAEFHRFIRYDVATTVLLGLAVFWAIRRVAGPVASAWTVLPLVTVAGGFLFFTSMIGAFLRGFAPQLFGTALLAILVAICARPLARTGEQILLTAVIIGAIALTYYFLIPIVGLVVLATAIQLRRRLLRYWLLVLVLAPGAVGLVVMARLVDSQGSKISFLTTAFGVDRLPRPAVVALVLISAAGLLTMPRWWRLTSARVLGVALLSATAMTLGIGALQLRDVGRTLYFFDKTMHALVVLSLIALGAWAGLLGRVTSPRGRVGSRFAARGAGRPVAGLGTAGTGAGTAAPLAVRRRSLAELASAPALSVLLSLGLLAPFGAYNPTLPPGKAFLPPGVSWGRAYLAARFSPATAQAVVRVVRQVPDPDGRTTVFMIRKGVANSAATLFTAVLQRDYGRSWPEYVYVGRQRTAKELKQRVLGQPGKRFQIVTDDPDTLAALRELARDRPDLELEVIDFRTLG